MKAKKYLLIMMTVILGLMCGCGQNSGKNGNVEQTETTKIAETTEATEPTEIIVFAAASLTETLSEIGEQYRTTHPGVSIVFNFESSGTLKTQIAEGAECDIFVSAGQKQMNELMEQGHVEESSRVDLLENKVVLCVPSGNPKELKNFDDLNNALQQGDILFAMGNSDVPVGQYTQKILAYYNLVEEDLAKKGVITYGSNVKEVTTQIAEGSVDAGVVYCTDAFSAGLTIADYATKEMCGQIIYPAAIIKATKNKEAAGEFLEYIKSDEAMKVFEKVGFVAVK